MTDYSVARNLMIDNQLRTNDVTDPRILSVMGQLRREEFVPGTAQSIAYSDINVAFPEGKRAVMAPVGAAKLVQLLDPKADEVALVVGCGTGYTAAVLAGLVSSVVALEEDEKLAADASRILNEQEIVNAAVVTGPLIDGWASEAPYDIILFDGSADFIPVCFEDQLKDGGRMAYINGQGLSGCATLVTRSGDICADCFGFNCCAAPLPGFAHKQEFAF